MSVRIITDSASDISQELAAEWNITVLPLKVRFGEEEFLDGVTLSNREFYERLIETDEIPKTSQITPFDYRSEFEKAVNAGDEAVCFCLSSGVSGSFQSACVAAQEFEGKIFVVDTQQFCISEAVIVERAVQMRVDGMRAVEIYSAIEEEKKDAHVLAIFNSLEYLKLGGRISSAAAFAGGLLNLKPVLTIEDGVVKILGKARGSRNGNNMLTEFAEKLGGIDFDRPYCFGYTGFSDETLKKYIHDSARLYEGKIDMNDPGAFRIMKVGATIGTYAGPGAIAVAFFSKK